MMALFSLPKEALLPINRTPAKFRLTWSPFVVFVALAMGMWVAIVALLNIGARIIP